jgi:hypothetical protein
MPCLVTAADTEKRIRDYLLARGYKLSSAHEINGATGPDIVAEYGERKVFIEVIGCKSNRSARSRDFFESFFRCVSRLKLDADLIVLACPHEFCDGIMERTTHYGRAWLRLGSAIPELELWFVYRHKPVISYAAWNYWAENYAIGIRPAEIVPPYRSRYAFGLPM